MKRRLIIVGVAVLVLVLGVHFSQQIPNSPEHALRMFYSSNVPEDQLMDPLILGGRSVVPLLILEIQNKDQPRRRYMIGALGNIGDPTALDTLTFILKNSSEEDYFRCDALEAVALIDVNLGLNLAGQYKGDPVQCLAERSRGLLSGKSPKRRSYVDALIGRHD